MCYSSEQVILYESKIVYLAVEELLYVWRKIKVDDTSYDSKPNVGTYLERFFLSYKINSPRAAMHSMTTA